MKTEKEILEVLELEDTIFLLSVENTSLKKKLECANKKTAFKDVMLKNNENNIQNLSNEVKKLKTIIEYLENKNV